MAISSDPSAPQIQCGKSPVHSCAVCHQQWGETMMQRVDTRWICTLCKERALADTLPPEQQRVQMRMGVPGLLWLKVITAIVIAAGIGFRIWVGSFRYRPRVTPRTERIILNEPAPEKTDAPGASSRSSLR